LIENNDRNYNVVNAQEKWVVLDVLVSEWSFKG